jgi:maleylacetate reductase
MCRSRSPRPGGRRQSAQALYGAWLGGIALTAGIALHHKICHTLGGSFDLPHGPTHTVILPHSTGYNGAAAPETTARIARALKAEDGPGGLFDLAGRIGAARALRDIGLKETDLERAADLVMAEPYPNPRLVTREGVRALLDDAFHGQRPGPHTS